MINGCRTIVEQTARSRFSSRLVTSFAGQPTFSLGADSENSVAGCLAARIYDYDTEAMVLALSFILVGHAGSYAEIGKGDV